MWWLILSLVHIFSAPPSYSECVFGKIAVAEEGENEYMKGDKDFAPVYPYYDWSKH